MILLSKKFEKWSVVSENRQKNEKLQEYCLAEHKKKLKLLIDCKTRWSSLCKMLERFYLLKSCVRKAMIDLDIRLNLSDLEFDTIKEIIDVLTPVKQVVEVICKRNTNLIVTDAVLDKLLKYLASQETTIATSLYLQLVSRIKERRMKLADILTYLHTGKTTTSIQSSLNIEPISKVELANVINKIVKPCLTNKSAQNCLVDDLTMFMEDEDGSEESEERLGKKQKTCSFTDQLQEVLSTSMEVPKLKSPITTTISKSVIKTEIQVFEISGERGPNLSMVYKSLLFIPGTSVESERSFSSAGYFCNKFRSSLSDEMLDILCILRNFFQTENLK